MSKVTHILRVEIDLAQPVPDICDAIAHVIQAYPGREEELLVQLKKAIDSHLETIKKGEKRDGKPIRESTGKQ